MFSVFIPVGHIRAMRIFLNTKSTKTLEKLISIVNISFIS